MGDWFETRGICEFAPSLNAKGKTTRRDGKSTEWWMILRCDREIGAYLRKLYAMSTHGVSELQEPLWGTHVSVIRDEEPPNLDRWRELEGAELTVRYSQVVEIHSSYAVVQAQCDEALDYRESLGLSREPELPLHMTIGNLKRS
ncbi:MAG: hypothetical protein AAF585_27740 [Verrucomicrobiota bacterium]